MNRTNDISWAVGALFSVVRAAHRVSEARSACMEAELRAQAASNAAEAALARHRRHGKRGDAASSSQQLLRVAAAQAATLRHGRPSSEVEAGVGEARRRDSALRGKQWRETLAWVALTRAACELVQAGPGAFELEPPSEFLYLACGLVNGALGVWTACVESD